MVEDLNNSIYNCSIVQLPKIHNRAGNLTALENTLRDKALLERFLEKQQREITEGPAETSSGDFDQKFGTANINTIDDVLNALFLKSLLL